MLVVPLIERKRDGETLSPSEWSDLIAAYAAERVPDYQMAALLMAVYHHGLEASELAALTDAMLRSGATLSFGDGVPPRIDKHSTGGVGDKVSLVLAPLAASCGVVVPMMSGRGLGHTGGTLDKLEAIPGFRTDLSLDAAHRQIERLGCAMMGQTHEIAPADRMLYALRDATATIEATPLIAASIMSKKLAEGLSGLVLDVKQGSGAFLPALQDGLHLARTMIGLGEERGCPTVALLTAMDRPLGHACGNALETGEALEALRGEGPADLMEVVFGLGSEMLLLGGVAENRAAARVALERALRSGDAATRFRRVVEAQGGDPAVVDDARLLPRAAVVEVVEAREAGFIERVDPRVIGRAVVAMGGGRQRTEDGIDPAVGFVVHVKPGARVEPGQPLATLHGQHDEHLAIARAALTAAVHTAGDPTPAGLPLISHRVTVAGVESLE